MLKKQLVIIFSLCIGCLFVSLTCILFYLSFENYNSAKSAYEIAVDNGFVGSEQEWLVSLVGSAGNKGEVGATGDKGDKGDKGDAGISIERIESVCVKDDNGNETFIFTFYFTDGTTSEVRVPIVNEVNDAENLITLLQNGNNVTFTQDISTSKNIIMKNGVLDGNGKTLDAQEFTISSKCALTTVGGEIKNLTVKNSFRGIGTGRDGIYPVENDITINNVIVDYCTYAINISRGNNKNLIVNDTVLYGWTSYSELANATFTNCTFGQGNTDYAYLRAYDNTSFVNCKFIDGFKIGAAT
jgi:hypothetical protein